MSGAENSWLYALYGWVPADHDRLYWVWQDYLWDDAGITPEGRDGDDVGLKSEDNGDDGHAGITPEGRDGDDVGLKSEDNGDDGHEDD